jgi:hypothetical protein
MSEENDENRKNPKIFSGNRTRDTVPDFRAQYQLNYEHMTKTQFTMYLNSILEKLVPRTKRNQRKVLRSACRAAGARCSPCGRRCAAGAAGDAWRAGFRCADCLRCNALRAGWLHSRGALRCTGCDAMRCAALHGARIVCDAMRCARAGCIRAVQAAPCFLAML